MNINVLLVDDQTLVREGLSSLLSLSDNVTVVAQASSGREAVRLTTESEPDVILMDIRMPDLNGIEAVELLRKKGFQTPVLMLTTFDDHESIMKAIQAGAEGYLLKDVSLEVLVGAIEALADGKTWLQPAITERIVQGLKESKAPENDSEQTLVEPLTDKEIAVLRLIAAGLSNNEIAESLFKSTGTVKNQVSSLMAKLGVRDRTRAVLKAIDLGLL
ncbi:MULTISPECIES: response regulator transcription factor [Idiomarina]|jgi:DNA-binding NarL/FixJ family response regulator|uniref:response regulator n=1 Tax=Idiomarina TaxID=135575 RepID=UPI000C69C3B3|nr:MULTISPECIES: response regulator transcription factor [Idiomarina]MAO67113.1 DNA-binding response regulator [Idiomarina sp.]MBF80235.1 DNA-binding response regulator [Idiomarina sp.]MBP58804.1 DNA-binding response regulator [Idiomarina sp.]|tara:strand:- start:16085 stop:16735 length:651 start_codon:yes stop_codon:yes gene_type:complete